MDFYSKKLSRNFKLRVVEKKLDNIYRNYYTIFPQQDLLDDLLDTEEEFSDVQSCIDGLSGIDKTNRFCSRPFEYAKAFPEITMEDILRPFLERNDGKFGVGRYGDGYNFGVFYSALELETSIQETIFHARNDFNQRKGKMTEDLYTQDRKMIKIGFNGMLIDLTCNAELLPELTGENYDTCQLLGKSCIKNNIDALKVPSARSTGTCFPIFSQNAIIEYDHKEAFVFNFRIIISKKEPTKVRLQELKERILDFS